MIRKLVIVMGLLAIGTLAWAAAAGEGGGASAGGETAADASFTYDKLRAMSEARTYEGEPAKGKKIAFANLFLVIQLTRDVQAGVIEEWALAGGDPDDLLILDNQIDTQVALDNAEIVFNSDSEVFLQFQAFTKVNAQIGRRATDRGVLMIGIDIPVPGFPFMGADNYGISQMTGTWFADHVDEIYGGWDNVDVVFLSWTAASGESTALRTTGVADVLTERFGETGVLDGDGSKVVSVNATGLIEGGQEEILNALAAYPDAENIVYFTWNNPEAAGVVEGAKLAGRWDPDKWTVIGMGIDEFGTELMEAGELDVDVNFHFNEYARYLIPGALAHIHGNSVPSHMFVEMELLESPQYR